MVAISDLSGEEKTLNDVEIEEFSKKTLTGIISPLSDPSQVIRMDD